MRGELNVRWGLVVVGLLAAALGGLGLPSPTYAFQIARRFDGTPNIIDSTITANPLEVVLWVRDTVTPENEAWITAEIEEGLALWESVATSRVSFTTTVVRSATRPSTRPEQIVVRVANSADLTTGGATLPGGGFPGEWLGAVADAPDQFRDGFHLVAAHEIGHTMGFLHSSVSDRFFGVDNNIPIMHWAAYSVTGLTADDAAAISLAYPNPGLPLGTVTATLRGRTTSLAAGLPIDGINVVAVDPMTGAPLVGRLSGAAGEPGVFNIIGLPSGDYEIYFLDGNSFAGGDVGLPTHRIQADNFATLILGPFSLGAGSVADLGDVSITIEPISVDRIGGSKGASTVDPDAGLLPTATFGQQYQAWLHLRGGVRPLYMIDSQGLPRGLGPTIETTRLQNADPHGEAFLHIQGTPREGGPFQVTLLLVDAHGVEGVLSYTLQVQVPGNPGPVLSSVGDQEISAGTLYVTRVLAAHPTGLPLTFIAEGAPLRSKFLPLGDVTRTGKLTTADVSLLEDFAVGRLVPTPEQEALADVDGDGVIGDADVRSVKDFVNGLTLSPDGFALLWQPGEEDCGTNHEVTLRVSDGLLTAAETVTLSVLPGVRLLRPPPVTSVYGRVRVEVQALCIGGALEWSVGGEPFSPMVPRRRGIWRIDWDSTTINDGIQNLSVRAMENLLGSWDVMVDNTGPLLQVRAARLGFGGVPPPAGDAFSFRGELAIPGFQPGSEPSGGAPWTVELADEQGQLYSAVLPELTCPSTRSCRGEVRGIGETGEGNLRVKLRQKRDVWRFTLRGRDHLIERPRASSELLEIVLCASQPSAHCVSGTLPFMRRGQRGLKYQRPR